MSAPTPFQFPPTYNFPPFFTPQPNSNTRLSQLEKWSSLIQAWCRHHHQYRLSLTDAIDSPLFHNTTLRKRLDLAGARDVVEWMTKSEEEGGGGRRAEWLDASAGVNGAPKSIAYIWWRRPEEWADVIADWVENTGQRGAVLTVYELVQGEATVSQGEMPPKVTWNDPLAQKVLTSCRFPWDGYRCHDEDAKHPR